MSIKFRCDNNNCRRFYPIKYKNCPTCGDKGKKYYIAYVSSDGKRHHKYAGETITAAKDLEAAIRLEEESFPEKIRLMDFVDRYFIPHHVERERAEDNYKAEHAKTMNIYNITKRLENKVLSEFKGEDFEKYLQSVITERGCKAGTRNRNLAVIKSIFNYAVTLGYLKKSPIKSNKIRTEDERIRYLTPSEKERLLRECKKSASKTLYDIVIIALKTGMRRGEIRALKRENIKDGFIIIKARDTKSRRSLKIPITPELQAIFDKTEGEFDFAKEVKESFRRAVRRAEISDFRFHDLRHTFASELVQKGVSIYTVSKLLGHSSIEMTSRYSHLSPESDLKAIMKLDETTQNCPTKQCPMCAEDIKAEAKICRFCGHKLE
jgi:integrase